MPPWLQHPATWIIAGVAVLTAIVAVARWTASVDADRKNFRAFMDEVRADIKQILRRLSPTTQTASPITLTALGREISNDIGAGGLAETLLPIVGPSVRGKTDYEVQEECIRYVLEDYEPPHEARRLILGSAYENGIDKEHVLRVIAIELRDRIFAEAGRPIPAPPR